MFFFFFFLSFPQVNTSKQLTDKLNRLQERLQGQMTINEQLIDEIDVQKEQILKGAFVGYP